MPLGDTNFIQLQGPLSPSWLVLGRQDAKSPSSGTAPGLSRTNMSLTLASSGQECNRHNGHLNPSGVMYFLDNHDSKPTGTKDKCWSQEQRVPSGGEARSAQPGQWGCTNPELGLSSRKLQGSQDPILNFVELQHLPHGYSCI